jgi:uncharacterized protein with PIN domain
LTATGIKVVDASALGALLFGEPGAKAIAGRLRAPDWLRSSAGLFELTDVCLTKVRRQPSQLDALRARSEERRRRWT